MLTFYCPECYAENRAQDRVCRQCGAPMNEEDGDYVERLIRFSLHHPVTSVAATAAAVLGDIGDGRAVEPLAGVLLSSEEPAVTEAAAEALGKLRDARAIPALQHALKTGALPLRMRAASALGAIGGDEAARTLAEAARTDPSGLVRKEAGDSLKRLNAAGGQAPAGAEDSNRVNSEIVSTAIHKRGIRITLAVVDEALCEIEEWANGREVRSVFYTETNTLSESQRGELLGEIARMRSILEEARDTLRLEPTVQDAASAIRGRCAAMWEHIVELQGKHLRRYGEVPDDLKEFLNPRSEQLIQSILHILDTLKNPGASE